MKRHNPSSDVPGARDLIEEVILSPLLALTDRQKLRKALAKLYRAKPIRKAPPHRTIITKRKRERVRDLVHGSKMTFHEIANQTGLNNSGRVTDIMQGRR
jgi:hypothetical protein